MEISTYQQGTRIATVESIITGDYQVVFTDTVSGEELYETYHTLEKAEDAAEDWVLNE